MKLFTFIFSEITDAFGIDSGNIGRCINRDPSRVRHWRKDSVPPKYIIDLLFQTVCELISENEDSYIGPLFISKMNTFFSNTSLFTSEITQKLLQISSLDAYIQFLLRRSYERDIEMTSELIDIFKNEQVRETTSTYSLDSELKYATFCAQVSAAHHDFEMNLFEEAANTYTELLSDPFIHQYPKEHLQILLDMGDIYKNDAVNKSEISSFHSCINYYQKALEIINLLKDQYQYARVNSQLGDTFYLLSRFENCDENFKRSFDAFNRALSVYINNQYINEYYTLLNTLGMTYVLYAEVRYTKKYLLKSISTLEKVGNDSSAVISSYIKYDSLFYLGTALSYLSSITNCRKNVIKSLQCLEDSLNYFTIEDYPKKYAYIHVNKSVALGSLVIFHNSVDACKQSLHHLQLAKHIINPESSPMGFGIVQLNLSATFTHLALFENSTENLENALTLLDECSLFFRNSQNPFFHGKSLTNFAELYIRIAEINHDTLHLDKAINALEDALCIFLPETYPHLYGMAHLFLGNAYYTYYINTLDTKYLSIAIDALSISATYITLEDYPLYHGLLQFYLGKIFSSLYKVNSSSVYLMSAKNAFTCATEVFSYKNYPEKFEEINKERMTLNI